MFKTKRLFVVVLTLVFAFSVGSFLIACGGDAFDDSGLIKRLEQVEKDKAAADKRLEQVEKDKAAADKRLEQLEKDKVSFSESIDKLKDELAAAKNRLLLLEGKVDGDPNKVYQLNDTVSYSSNGLKLFEIKLTGIGLVGDGRTYIDFDFTPYTFVEPFRLVDFLSAQLIDESTQTNFNNNGSISGPIKRFLFTTVLTGNKTLYLCISSASMYIPFAVYNLKI